MHVIICKSDKLKSLICSDVITKLERNIINIKWINNDLEVTHPLNGSSSTWFLKLNLEMLVFKERTKTEAAREKLLGAREININKLNTHI